jgi:hypothetical protein
MTTALDLIEAEERRRDELVATVRHVVAQNYAAGGDTGFCVRRSDVHTLVAEALAKPVLGGQLISTVNAIVVGMGAVATSIGNRPVFLALRRLDLDAKAARALSKELRRRWRARKPKYRQRARPVSEDERQKWERRLKDAGLGEVALIPTQGGAGLSSREGRGLAKAGGVHRQRPATQAEIYAGANERATEVLAGLELDVAVMRLRAQGKALRPIAIALGLQKDQVAAILKRLGARHPAEGCE